MLLIALNGCVTEAGEKSQTIIKYANQEWREK